MGQIEQLNLLQEIINMEYNHECQIAMFETNLSKQMFSIELDRNTLLMEVAMLDSNI